MIKIPLITLIIGCLIHFQWSLAQKIDYPNYPADSTICEAIEFSVLRVDGQTMNSKNLKGNIVVINFWGINCQPCVKEIPDLNQLVQEFETEKVQFIAITHDEKSDLIPFLQKHPFLYQVAIAPNYTDLMIKWNNNILSVPLHIIINKEWKIVYRYMGKLEGADLLLFKQKIKEQL